MTNVWLIEGRHRQRKNGKWSEWESVYGSTYYMERPVNQEIKEIYYERRDVEYIRREVSDE